jgi:hypothetical protein
VKTEANVDNDGRFDLGDLDDDSPTHELEPITLQQAADILCRAASTLTPEQKAECRAVLMEQLGVDMTIVECTNCGELIRRSHFNSDVVWVHEPGFCGPWPNTRCKTGQRAIPVFTQLLTEDDKSFLEEARIKYE